MRDIFLNIAIGALFYSVALLGLTVPSSVAWLVMCASFLIMAWPFIWPPSPLITLECSQCAPPTILPDRPRVNTVAFLPNGTGSFGAASGPIGMCIDTSIRVMNECKIINHSDQPIFDLRFNFRVIFRQKSNDAQGGITAGTITRDKEWPMFLDRLDPGVSGAFVVYLTNGWDEFLNVNFPAMATGKIGNNARAQVLTIRKSRNSDLFLYPKSLIR
jgi:hypothetical protein